MNSQKSSITDVKVCIMNILTFFAPLVALCIIQNVLKEKCAKLSRFER